MPNLDNLNFDLIINDKDFNAKIEQAELAANQLNVTLSQVLSNLGKIPNGGEGSKHKNTMLQTLYKDMQRTEDAIAVLESKYKKLVDTTTRNPQVTSSVPVKNMEEYQLAIEGAKAKLKEMQDLYASMGGRDKMLEGMTEVEKQTFRTNEELRKMKRTGKDIDDVMKGLPRSSEKMEASLKRSSKLWQQMGTLAAGYFSVYGAERLITSLVRITSEFEKQKVALGAILQDTAAANDLYEQIQKLAVKSPFNFKELATYAKQLSAYSIPVGELYDTTKMLADMSAGLGIGMDRLVLAYGQIRSAAFLRGTEVRQLTEAGIPIIAELQRQIEAMEGASISAAAVFDRISTRQISFQMVEKAFKDMTSEGGKFYNMQEVLAETLSGKLSNLVDAYQMMMSEMGNKNRGIINATVELLYKMIDNYEKIGRLVVGLVATYGAYKVAIAAVAAMEAWEARVAIAANAGISKSMLARHLAILKLTKAQQVLNKLQLTNPYVLAAAGLTALITAFIQWEKRVSDGTIAEQRFNKYIEEQNGLIEKNNKAVKESLDVAKDSTKAHDDRLDAMRKIIEQYPVLLENYKSEKEALEDIANVEKIIAKEELKSQWSRYNNEMGRLKEKIEDINKSISAGTLNNPASLSYLYAEKANLEKEIPLLQKAMDDLMAQFNGADEGGAAKVYEGWRKSIADIINEASSQKINIGVSFSVDNLDTTTLDNVIEEVQSRMEEVSKSIYYAEGNESQEILDTYKMQLTYLTRINKALKEKSYSSKNGKNTDNPYAEQIKSLKAQASEVQRLIDAYKKLQDVGMSNASISAWLKTEWGRDVTSLKSLEDEVRSFADELEKLGDEGAAQSLRDSVKKDITDVYVGTIKAYREFTRELEKWLAEDFTADGEGMIGKVQQLLRKVNTDNNLVGINAEEMKKRLYEGLKDAYEYAKMANSKEAMDYYLEYKQVFEQKARLIDETAKKEIEANKKVAAERARDLADEIVKQNYSTNKSGSLDMSALGRKSVAELRRYADSISSMMDEANTAKAQYAKNLLSEYLNPLLDAMMEIYEADKANIDYNMFKKLKDRANGASQAVSKLGSELTSIGDNVGSDVVDTFGKVLSLTGEISDTILECVDYTEGLADAGGKLVEGVDNIIKSSDWITMAIKLALIAVREIGSVIGKNVQEQKDLAEAAAKYRDTLYEIAQASRDTIFGEDVFGKMSDSIKFAQSNLKTLSRTWDSVITKINNVKLFNAIGFENLVDVIGGYSGSMLNLYTDGLQDVLASGNLDNIKKIYTALSENQKTLQKGLSRSQKAQFEELLTYLEDYVGQLEDFESQVSELFNNLASSIADNMITAFNETGDAVSNLTESFNEMGQSIIKSVMQSWLLENVLNQYEDDIKRAMTAYSNSDKSEEKLSTFLESLDSIFSAMQQGIEGAGDTMNKVLEQAKDFGWFSTESEGDTLASGIKGITEDTANLLASYVNAIRADVAANRMQVAQILALLPSAPTLSDYLNKIQGNTYDTAQNTSQILESLNSIITSETGASAVRVLM